MLLYLRRKQLLLRLTSNPEISFRRWLVSSEDASCPYPHGRLYGSAIHNPDHRLDRKGTTILLGSSIDRSVCRSIPYNIGSNLTGYGSDIIFPHPFLGISRYHRSCQVRCYGRITSHCTISIWSCHMAGEIRLLRGIPDRQEIQRNRISLEPMPLRKQPGIASH